ncbi:SAM-dependent methyltransferase [Candidatus Pelagibacter sp.]|nr:SAM-dependent methyltransferase [Candidatus Pelagibacter sp.]
MKTKKILNLPLDKFINYCLYNKEFGYYMKKYPFGKDGDFVTAPNVSRLFSEMIAIWVFSFWQSLGSPKKFNLIELGAGNGEMMRIMIESLKNFPVFFKSCNFIIHEKSSSLINIQKKKLLKNKIVWVKKITRLKNIPSIFVANEFFDALAIKQFMKKNNLWFEKFVRLKDSKDAQFNEKKINIKDYEKKIDLKLFQNQDFIEYSELSAKYLKDVGKIIKKNSGGFLIIDYGYNENKMKNTIQGVMKHKYTNILKNIGKSDITHNINFKLFQKIIDNLGDLKHNLTTQKNFLTRMGINERAEIISKNYSFKKKADMYYRLKRLIHQEQMGNLFKVMLIKNKKNRFNLGF